jgi:thiol-disulfide isomerase/thioredoxin
MPDQYGDVVSLFDFYNADKPVVIDLSALWCGPCNNLADYIGGEGDPANFSAYWPAGPDVIARGDVYWITFIGEGIDQGGVATPADATEWSNVHPSAVVPVLADEHYSLYDYIALQAWPALVLLGPDLKVTVFDPDDYSQVLLALAEQFPE